MRGTWICVMTVLLLTGMVIPAAAVGGGGEIRVTLDFGDGEVHEGAVYFCQVAHPEGDHYRLKDSFGGGLIKREDAVSDALAQWLTELMEEEGKSRILDADGSACFTGLEAGLYLLIQDGPIENMEPFDPILVTMPSAGQWQLTAYPQTRMIQSQLPQTGQSICPALGMWLLTLSGLGLVLILVWHSGKNKKAQ